MGLFSWLSLSYTIFHVADMHLFLPAFELVVLEWIFKLRTQLFYLIQIGIHRQWNFFYMTLWIVCFIAHYLWSVCLLVYFQVDLQAQARAHRIGQKRDVLVLRFETVSTFCSELQFVVVGIIVDIVACMLHHSHMNILKELYCWTEQL